MKTWFQVNWERAFLPQTPVLELIIRGSVIYLVLFALLRVILKRQSGTLGLTDLLVIVLIADAAQNAVANEYRSITEGLVLVTTISGALHPSPGPAVGPGRACAPPQHAPGTRDGGRVDEPAARAGCERADRGQAGVYGRGRPHQRGDL